MNFKYKKRIALIILAPIIFGLITVGWYKFEVPFASASCGGGYSYCRTITLDHTKIGNGTEDETYFPWEASSTIATLATVGNGGHVQNTTTQTGSSYTGTVPADAIFTSDSACSTKLNWEFESYNSATGNLIAWIANSSTALSHTSDPVVYLCYGNSSVTTWQGNVNGTWNSNYVAVYHFPNGTTLNANDSTSNGNNGTGQNSPSATSGQIDGGVGLLSASTQYVNVADSASLDPTAITVSAWVKGTNWPNGYNAIAQKGNSNYFWEYFIRYDGTVAVYVNATNGGTDYDGTGSHTLTTGTWNMVTFTYDSTNGIIGYVNGAVDDTVGVSEGALVAEGVPMCIGNDCVTSPRFWNGSIDEVNLSNVARSAGWISTEYNNQSAPDKANYGSGGFYTVGTEQSGGGGATTVPHAQEIIQADVIVKGQKIIY